MAVAHQHIGAGLPHPALQQGSLTLGEIQQGRAGGAPWFHTVAYLAAEAFGRMRKMMPCRIGHQASLGARPPGHRPEIAPR